MNDSAAAGSAAGELDASRSALDVYDSLQTALPSSGDMMPDSIDGTASGSVQRRRSLLERSGPASADRFTLPQLMRRVSQACWRAFRPATWHDGVFSGIMTGVGSSGVLSSGGVHSRQDNHSFRRAILASGESAAEAGHAGGAERVTGFKHGTTASSVAAAGARRRQLAARGQRRTSAELPAETAAEKSRDERSEWHIHSLDASAPLSSAGLCPSSAEETYVCDCRRFWDIAPLLWLCTATELGSALQLRLDHWLQQRLLLLAHCF